ncbi:hypothetical protein GCM10009111_26620 [Colwellia asteriadis]|uniref:Uncharacterized protein n=1 Tax=Colwellia asteriadis TaxID=517723 RepID=A0ABN1L9R5_9GAMM
MRQLSNDEIKSFARGIWLISALLSPALLFIYWIITKCIGVSLFPHIVPKNTDLLISILTSFSMTMTGFIAAIGAYILSVSNNPSFTLWRNAGYLKLFYHLYAAAITFLLFTFSLCILMLLSGQTIIWLKIILTLIVVNFIHIALITTSAINQTKNSTQS